MESHANRFLYPAKKKKRRVVYASLELMCKFNYYDFFRLDLNANCVEKATFI